MTRLLRDQKNLLQSVRREAPVKMLHAKIILATFVFSLIEAHSTHETEKTMGELMLSPGGAPKIGGVFLEITPNEQTVQFFLYTREDKVLTHQLIISDVKALNQSNFDPTKKTLVVIHGYQSYFEAETVQGIKNAALDYHDVNVIAVDWGNFAMDLNYEKAVSMVEGVGNYVGQLIEFLITQGAKSTDIHLIGHSLGAHVAGFAGKLLITNGHTAARITGQRPLLQLHVLNYQAVRGSVHGIIYSGIGLDPAFPGFYNTFNSKDRLNSTDAEFVDCIHTSGGKLGFPFPICQADFFPNGGTDAQPGCSLFDFGTCSHGRSHEYFAESLNPTHLFDAESCKWFAFGPFYCHDEGALMGYPAAPKFKGSHTLKTNSEYPFANNVINK